MTKHDPKPIFLEKKTSRSKFFGKLLGNLSFIQPQAIVAKKGLLRDSPKGIQNVSWSWWCFWPPGETYKRFASLIFPMCFFPMIPLLVQEAGQKKSQDPRDPFVMKGSIGLTIFGRSMSPAWKGGTCYIIFCWHCGVLVATVNCRMCCLWMFVMCKRIHILIYEGKYSTACTTPSNTFILTILKNIE